MTLSLRIALIIAFAGAPSLAHADEPSGTLRLSARVPEYCEIRATSIIAPAGDGVATGSVFESCNTQSGFQVIASHRPLEADERAAFAYGGEVKPLSAGGSSAVANRIGAKFGSRPISVSYSALRTPLAIDLTITAF